MKTRPIFIAPKNRMNGTLSLTLSLSAPHQHFLHTHYLSISLPPPSISLVTTLNRRKGSTNFKSLGVG